MRMVEVRILPPQPKLPASAEISIYRLARNVVADVELRRLIEPSLLLVNRKTSAAYVGVLPPMGMVHWVWFWGRWRKQSGGRSRRPSPQSPKGILGSSSPFRVC